MASYQRRAQLHQTNQNQTDSVTYLLSRTQPNRAVLEKREKLARNTHLVIVRRAHKTITNRIQKKLFAARYIRLLKTFTISLEFDTK